MFSHEIPSAQEILDRIRAQRAAETFRIDLAPATIVPTDTFAPRLVHENNARVVGPAFSFNQNRDCFKEGTSENEVKTATALNIKRDKEFKAVAPLAHHDCQVNPVFSGGEINALAPAAATPANTLASVEPTNTVAPSPCSSADEEKTSNPDAHSVPTDEPDEREVELMDINVFSIRADHFDNGAKKGGRRYRTKFFIQQEPNAPKSDEVVVFANYWSRHRDWRGGIEDDGMWNSFYEDLYGRFQQIRKSKVAFDIEPIIATLKMPNGNVDEADWDMIPYSAAVFWKEAGCAATVYVVYEAFAEFIDMDVTFEKSEGSKLLCRGDWIDPTRAHLQRKQAKGTNYVRRTDLLKKR